MRRTAWEDIRLPPADADAAWELFHENSKTGRYQSTPTPEQVRERLAGTWAALPFVGSSVVELPAVPAPVRLPLEEAIVSRATTRRMVPGALSLGRVAAILRHAYGITRENDEAVYPRSFRTVPSAGALYPLEVFVHVAHVDGLPAGLYHYDPTRNHLGALRQGDESSTIAGALVQPELASNASMIVFLTAIFERSTFKYGDRGYRFVLLEAGHVAQNINLTATGCGLGCVNIGGFFDREVDEYLGLDGIRHSTIYLVAIGQMAAAA